MTRQGGGVSPSQKTVKLGDTYGDLPIPTREGYTFNRWVETGKNKAQKNELTITADSSSGTTLGYVPITVTSLAIQYVFAVSFDYKITARDSNISSIGVKAKFFSNTTSSTENSEYSNLAMGTWHRYAKVLSVETSLWYNVPVGLYIACPNVAGTLSMEVKNIQIETGSTITDYEPYEYTSTTQYTKVGDQTLKALWTANSYTVSFDSNYNLLNNLTSGTYTGHNLTITFNGLGFLMHNHSNEDPYATIGQTVDLVEGQKYVVHGEIRDGTSSSGALSTGGSIQLFYAINEGYTEAQSVRFDNNSQSVVFTAPTTGTYKLRMDNDYGKDVGVYNFSIKNYIDSRSVTYMNSYGSLPTPTRTGYSFLGWRGRNLANVNAVFGNSHVTCNVSDDGLVSITNEAHTADGTDRFGCGTIPLEDLSNGKYLFSIDEISYSGECNWPYVYACGNDSSDNRLLRVGESINYSVGMNSICFDAENIEKIASGTFRIEIYLSASYYGNGYPSFSAGSLSFKNLMLTKIEDENEVVNYEPYYITSDTVLNNIGDRTLTAMWKAN